MPTISIIVPIYNTELYLSRCLDSILNQSFTDFELLLINDGSTDNSQKVIDVYSSLDNRVLSFEKSNGGLSEARNLGLENAKGEYITFVDSDDWLNQDFLAINLNALISNNSDLSISNFLRTDKAVADFKYDFFSVTCYSREEALTEIYGRFATSFTVSWGKLYKKILFEQLRFPVGRLHEDEYITYKAIYFSNKIVFVDVPLYYYFQRSNSIMGSPYRIKSGFDAMDAMIDRFYFFKFNNINLLEEAYFSVILIYGNAILKSTINEMLELNILKKRILLFRELNPVKPIRLKRRLFEKLVICSPKLFKISFSIYLGIMD